jgi:broad specificity phosphatase PhoE
MPHVYLVRHGETEWNRERRWQGQHDLPLTTLGAAQARAAGRRLASVMRPAALYSSPLPRAWQTALLIGESLGLEPECEDDLQEVDVGSWQGLTSDEAAQQDPDGHIRWLAGGTGWTGGETYAEMGERACAAIERLAARHEPDDRVVAITHGGPIRAIVTQAVGLPPEGRRFFANGPNGSITVVDVGEARWTVVSYNDAGHVEHLTRDALTVRGPATE